MEPSWSRLGAAAATDAAFDAVAAGSKRFGRIGCFEGCVEHGSFEGFLEQIFRFSGLSHSNCYAKIVFH